MLWIEHDGGHPTEKSSENGKMVEVVYFHGKQRWLNRIVAVLFIVIGIYYLFVTYL